MDHRSYRHLRGVDFSAIVHVSLPYSSTLQTSPPLQAISIANYYISITVKDSLSLSIETKNLNISAQRGSSCNLWCLQIMPCLLCSQDEQPPRVVFSERCDTFAEVFMNTGDHGSTFFSGWWVNSFLRNVWGKCWYVPMASSFHPAFEFPTC